MDEIPVKVVCAASLEVGLFIGLGIMVFHTFRVIATATKNHTWAGFRDL